MTQPGEQARPYETGDTVTDFSLPALDGGIGRLSDYPGKIIVLFFMATW